MDGGRRARGQILVLFTLALVAILAMLALLFDGAFAYAQRRSLQNASDAAAVAGSNAIEGSTCSATGGFTPGPPRAAVVAAVLASVQENLPGFPTANIQITCPANRSNVAVRVKLSQQGGNFLSAAIGVKPLDVATVSTAINGHASEGDFSIVLLNPGPPATQDWPQARRGCPSMLFSGGPTAIFEGAVQVDSACPSSMDGALGTNGAAPVIKFENGGELRMVGEWNQGSLTITPAPVMHSRYYPDPLLWVPPVDWSSLTVQSTKELVLNNEVRTLEPGIYTGGLELRNVATALLRPGIYVFNGGGLKLGAHSTFCSIPGTGDFTSCDNWSTTCADTNCGVLLFNRGDESTMGQVTVAAGATLRMKAYDDRATCGACVSPPQTPVRAYRNIVAWQDKNPVPTKTYAQPVVSLNGGGNFEVSGTIYAPSALVHLGGTSGGAGGGPVDLTVQFIVWDFEIQGNAQFHFFYGSDLFPKPLQYGLIE